MLLLFPTANAQAPIEEAEPPLTGKGEYVEYATKKAVEANISPSVVLSVIECESQWNERAIGDGTHSRGLAQIHNLYHPDISDEEAYDARFAIDFLVENIAEGRGNMWTCYRKLK